MELLLIGDVGCGIGELQTYAFDISVSVREIRGFCEID